MRGTDPTKVCSIKTLSSFTSVPELTTDGTFTSNCGIAKVTVNTRSMRTQLSGNCNDSELITSRPTMVLYEEPLRRHMCPVTWFYSQQQEEWQDFRFFLEVAVVNSCYNIDCSRWFTHCGYPAAANLICEDLEG